MIRPPRAKPSTANKSAAPSTGAATQDQTASGDSPPLYPDEQSDDDDLQVPETPPQDEIQIMDLHTRKPIVSYQNQAFSCSWADMVGTELLFAHPEEHSDLPALRRNNEYDLLSANRVKIIGKKGTLVASSYGATGPVRQLPPAAEQENPNPAAAAAGEEPASSAPNNRPTKRPHTNQARFLERLMDAKRARGENDIVRTVFNQKRSEEFESRLRGWARTEEQMAEFERLNRRVLQGDQDALEALEDLYDELEGAGPTMDADDYDSYGLEDGSQSWSSHGDTMDTDEAEDRNGVDSRTTQ